MPFYGIKIFIVFIQILKKGNKNYMQIKNINPFRVYLKVRNTIALIAPMQINIKRNVVKL